MCSQCSGDYLNPDHLATPGEIEDALAQDTLQAYLERCYAVYLRSDCGSFIQERVPSLKIETAVDSMNRWQACQEGTLDGENDIIGTGSSEDEAIENLLEKLDVTV